MSDNSLGEFEVDFVVKPRSKAVYEPRMGPTDEVAACLQACSIDIVKDGVITVPEIVHSGPVYICLASCVM